MAFITAETRSDIIALIVTMLDRETDSELVAVESYASGHRSASENLH